MASIDSWREPAGVATTSPRDRLPVASAVLPPDLIGAMGARFSQEICQGISWRRPGAISGDPFDLDGGDLGVGKGRHELDVQEAVVDLRGERAPVGGGEAGGEGLIAL